MEIKKLKVFTAFSGYDSQCMALDKLVEKYPGFEYELIGWSEIDEPAIQSHNAVFPQWADRNYGDISKINWEEVDDIDLFTYSSPCQDFSICGKQRGGTEGSGTRSSLLWECQRCIEAKRPKFLILENVKALVSEKFKPLFLRWKATVDSYGYDSYWQVLNARDYDIPQNRERVFLVSIRRDEPGVMERYYFPAPMEQKRQIVDFLDKSVPEEYYLKPDAVEKFYDLLDNAGVDYEETSEYSETNIKKKNELGDDYQVPKKNRNVHGLLDILYETSVEDIESEVLCDSSCCCSSGEYGAATEIDGYVPDNQNALF